MSHCLANVLAQSQTMVKPLSLPIIRELSTDTPYGGYRSLDSMSAATLLSIVPWLDDLNNWEGDGYSLTESEIDEIQAVVAEINDNLLTEGSTPVSDYTKIVEVNATSDVAYLDTGIISFSGYNILKVFISGLMTDRDDSQYDHMLLSINQDTTPGTYKSFNWNGYYNSGSKVENIGDRNGLFLYRSCVGSEDRNGFFGNIELTMFRPNASDYLNVSWTSNAFSGATGELNTTIGQGTYKDTTPRASFRITPYNGDYFLIDPASSVEPDYLQMTVFGLG